MFWGLFYRKIILLKKNEVPDKFWSLALYWIDDGLISELIVNECHTIIQVLYSSTLILYSIKFFIAHFKQLYFITPKIDLTQCTTELWKPFACSKVEQRMKFIHITVMAQSTNILDASRHHKGIR